MRGERRNREQGQDADNYNYPRSQSVIISSRPFFSLPKSECAAVLLSRPPSQSSPQLVKTHQSLVWGGDSRGGNLSKLARIVSSSYPNCTPSWNSKEGVLNSFLQSSTYQNIWKWSTFLQRLKVIWPSNIGRPLQRSIDGESTIIYSCTMLLLQ